MLVELSHELLLALPVHNEQHGPAAELEEPDHPVVGLGAQLVDLQLWQHHLPVLLALFV